MTMLLRSKLHRPTVRDTVLDRERLFSKLDKALQHSVTLVAAPAGFGKSTLISSWIERRNIEAAWYSCDPFDNDVERVLTYLIAALGTIDRQVFADLQAMVDAEYIDVQLVIVTLIDVLLSQQRRFVVVIDDVHLVPEGALNEALAPLLQHDIPTLHLILAGREDPPLPLARLRAQGRLADIRAADLRVDGKDLPTLMRTVYGVNVSDEDAADLLRTTEGWMTGIVLAAVRLQGADDQKDSIKAMVQNDKFVLDYLVQDVLNQLSDEMQKALLLTSLCDRFHPELISVLTDMDGTAFIQEAIRRNLFIVDLDEDHGWYRFHHLVADLFRRIARLRYPAEVHKVIEAAGLWFADHDENELAISMLREVEAEDVKDEILIRLWATDIRSYDWPYICEIVLGMSPERRMRDVRLGVFALQCALSSLRFALLPQLRAELEKAVESEHNPALRSYAMGIIYESIAFDRRNVLDYEENIAEFVRATETLESTPVAENDNTGLTRNVLLASIYQIEVNIIRTLQGLLRIDEAANKAYKLYDRGRTTFTREQQAVVEQDIMRGELLAGRINRAVESRERIREIEREGSFIMVVPHELDYTTLCARIAYDRGDIDDALQYLEDIEALMRRRPETVRVRMHNALVLRTRVAISIGDRDMAERTSNELVSLPYPVLTDYYREGARTMHTATTVRFGGTDGVEAWLQHVEEHLVPTRFSSRTHTLGRLQSLLLWLNIHARRGTLAPHQSIVDEYREFGTRMRLPRLLIECDRLDLMRAKTEGDTKREMSVLKHLNDLIESTDCRLPMFWLDDKSSTRTQEVVDTSAHTATPSHSLYELSPRELDTLRHLAKGLSNQRIADALYVSLATVKTHLYNIFQKMDVRTRSEAIVKARNEGIIL